MWIWTFQDFLEFFKQYSTQLNRWDADLDPRVRICMSGFALVPWEYTYPVRHQTTDPAFRAGSAFRTGLVRIRILCFLVHKKLQNARIWVQFSDPDLPGLIRVHSIIALLPCKTKMMTQNSPGRWLLVLWSGLKCWNLKYFSQNFTVHFTTWENSPSNVYLLTLKGSLALSSPVSAVHNFHIAILLCKLDFIKQVIKYGKKAQEWCF